MFKYLLILIAKASELINILCHTGRQLINLINCTTFFFFAYTQKKYISFY